MNVSAEDVDNFIQDVITNTSRKTPKGKNEYKIQKKHISLSLSTREKSRRYKDTVKDKIYTVKVYRALTNKFSQLFISRS